MRLLPPAALGAAFLLVSCAQATDRAPVIHSGLAKRVLATPGTQWITGASEHFHLHALANTRAARDLVLLANEAERARADDLELLGEQDPRTHELLFVDSRVQMAQLLGYPAGGHAQTDEDSAYFVHESGLHAALKHEIMHLISFHLWGTPSEAWMGEGLATLAAGGCRTGNWTVHQMAASSRRTGKLISLAEFDDRFKVQSGDAYAQAGSVVEFVRETYGLNAVHSLWTNGLDSTARSTTGSLETFEKAWLARIAIADDGRVLDWNAVRKTGCE